MMDLSKLQEKVILGLDHEYYFVVARDGSYYVDSAPYIADYNELVELVKYLNVEECKFLIAESVMDSITLYEYFHTLYSFSTREDFRKAIQSLNEEELNKVIQALKFTESFNGYLCYMLKDWETDNFESKEERMNYVY